MSTLGSMVGLPLEQTARGAHKRKPGTRREEGYAVTMETALPSQQMVEGKTAGGWCGDGGTEIIICARFPS